MILSGIARERKKNLRRLINNVVFLEPSDCGHSEIKTPAVLMCE